MDSQTNAEGQRLWAHRPATVAAYTHRLQHSLTHSNCSIHSVVPTLSSSAAAVAQHRSSVVTHLHTTVHPAVAFPVYCRRSVHCFVIDPPLCSRHSCTAVASQHVCFVVSPFFFFVVVRQRCECAVVCQWQCGFGVRRVAAAAVRTGQVDGGPARRTVRVRRAARGTGHRTEGAQEGSARSAAAAAI